MASIDVGIHPDPAGITTHHFPGGPPATFSTIEIRANGANAKAAIFVNRREVLDALQAALDEIRADFDAAEQAADADVDARDENAKTAARENDDWPSVLSDMAPGEAVAS